ncbi:hypothetical protein [Candidatus Villigracilis saccharophilus]|uniref:hypothetical protein n=1 Tax=Candidatus Villigracilis saccharophilus TaxID=3140684 RepID=UPI003136890C|nr:EAL domain-containing protein [Anaerolineales bacterium]
MLAVNRTDLADMVRSIKQRDILLLAEKVETPQDFFPCLQLGFDFFQGYFFINPRRYNIRRRNWMYRV